MQSVEQDPHLIQELFYLLCKVNKDRNYLVGCDRILGQVGVEELCFVDHVSGMSDVGLQLLVEGKGEVELVQRLPVRLLLLLQFVADLLGLLVQERALGFELVYLLL